MFSFNLKKVDWKKKLGGGRFGNVYAYKSSKPDDPCVVKHLTTNNEHEMIEYVQEIVLGFGCSHPNVLAVRGYSIQFEENVRNWNVFIKLSQMESSLKDRLNQKKRFSEDQIAKYFYDLSSGLSYLHAKGIAHRDIKPDNILINKNDELQIADFGLCKFIGEDMSYTLKDFAGTRQYTAPEIFAETDKSNAHLKKRDLFKADLWSLGLVMAELCLSGSEKQSEFELPEKIKMLQRKGYSKVLIELISSLLQVKPSNRKPLHEIQKTLEEGYPFLLKKRNKEVPTSFDTKIRKPIEKFDKQSQDDFALVQKKIEEGKFAAPTLSKQEIDKILKEFQKKWEEDFKIEIKFRESVKIEAAHKDITDNHLKSLMEEFARVQNVTKNTEIKQFEMNLEDCLQITDDGVKKIAQKIGSILKSVHQLILIFDSYPVDNNNITDSSLEELAQQIGSNLKNIEELRLGFGGCLISDEGIKKLSTQIGANLKTIQKLTLVFYCCEEITDDGINKLSQKITLNLKKLQELTLYFFNCFRVSEQAKEKLKRSCNFITKLEIY